MSGNSHLLGNSSSRVPDTFWHPQAATVLPIGWSVAQCAQPGIQAQPQKWGQELRSRVAYFLLLGKRHQYLVPCQGLCVPDMPPAPYQAVVSNKLWSAPRFLHTQASDSGGDRAHTLEFHPAAFGGGRVCK